MVLVRALVTITRRTRAVLNNRSHLWWWTAHAAIGRQWTRPWNRTWTWALSWWATQAGRWRWGRWRYAARVGPVVRV